jgi:hypothetical protein
LKRKKEEEKIKNAMAEINLYDEDIDDLECDDIYS